MEEVKVETHKEEKWKGFGSVEMAVSKVAAQTDREGLKAHGKGYRYIGEYPK